MRAALYARRSTEEHQAASLDVQLEEGRRFIAQKGWQLEQGNIYVDSGISRAEFKRRPALLAMLSAVERGEIEVVVTRDESRLGGDMTRVSLLLQDMLDAGAQVFYYFTGERVQLDNAIAKFMITARNFASELEREKIAQRTHEHLLVKARKGLNVGGRVYGYKNIEVMDGERRKHVEYAVDDDQAAIVREIFDRYGNGEGLRTVVRSLNARRIPSPRAGGRGTGTWSTSAIWSMVRRSRYVGIIEWNKKEKTYRKGTKVRIPREECEWIRIEAPELAIVSKEAWDAVQGQIRKKAPVSDEKRPDAKKGGRPPGYMLTGATRCGICGGPITAVQSRTGTTTIKAYACAYRHDRGEAVCSNRHRRPVDGVNRAVADWIQANVFSEELLLDALKEVRRRLEARAKQSGEELPRLEAEAAKLKAQIDNLVDVLAVQKDKPAAILEGIHQRQEQLTALDTRIRAMRAAPEAVQFEVRRMEAEAKARLQNFRDLLEKNPKEAQKLVAAIFDRKLVARPVETEDGPRFQIEGTADVGRMLAIEVTSEGLIKNPPKNLRPQRESNALEPR